jgi:hypothetical protein
MLRRSHARRSLALGAALVMTTWGAAAVPAAADPGSGKSGHHAKSGGKTGSGKGHAGQGNGGQSKGNAGQGNGGQSKGNAGQGNAGQGNSGQGNSGQDHSSQGNSGQGNSGQGNSGQGNSGQGNNGQGSSGGTSQGAGNGNAGGKGQGADGGKGGSKGDPGGNNGTVKIAPLGEMDGIPNNSPHPGCTFQVEWYGFDEGDDIVSTVGFAMQSPTKDVGLSVAGDTSVFVGGDPATGAGTDTGLDGTEVYTLSFDGEPHPKQGYHVKLTVHTPRSNGNDSKTKVFWVEPCQSTPGGGTGGVTEEEEVTPGTDDETSDTDTDTETGPVEDVTTPDSDIEVLGEQASDESDTGVSPAEAEAEAGTVAGAQAGTQAGTDDSNVPTAVDAGQSALDWVRSPLPLLVIALGAVLGAAALVTRRRTRVRAGG